MYPLIGVDLFFVCRILLVDERILEVCMCRVDEQLVKMCKENRWRRSIESTWMEFDYLENNNNNKKLNIWFELCICIAQTKHWWKRWIPIGGNRGRWKSMEKIFSNKLNWFFRKKKWFFRCKKKVKWIRNEKFLVPMRVQFLNEGWLCMVRKESMTNRFSSSFIFVYFFFSLSYEQHNKIEFEFVFFFFRYCFRSINIQQRCPKQSLPARKLYAFVVVPFCLSYLTNLVFL